LFVASASYCQEFTVAVDAKYPHPNRAFTQGITINNGIVTESSGLYNKSFVQSYQIGDNAALNFKRLPGHYFAEGLETIADETFVLTWKEQSVLVLNANDFSVQRKMHYDGEGWGLTTDGKNLVMSNGSNIITFRSKERFNIIKQIAVTDETGPVTLLNELEWIEDQLYANIWQQDLLVVINPDSGNVIKKLIYLRCGQHLIIIASMLSMELLGMQSIDKFTLPVSYGLGCLLFQLLKNSIND
jgi:glutamine cyclotransferase